MTALRRLIHQPDPATQEKVNKFTHRLRIGAVALLAGLVLWAVCGCTATGTPAQQEAARIKRGKNIAKVEKRAWSLGGFLVDLLANVAVNSATNFVSEKLGGDQPRSYERSYVGVSASSAGGRTLAGDRGYRK